MSEAHYSGSKQRFMLARTYYGLTADEQNAGEGELEESHALFSGFLTAFTFPLLLQLSLDLSLCSFSFSYLSCVSAF